MEHKPSMPIREANEASEANETIGAQIGQVIDVLQRRSVVVVGLNSDASTRRLKSSGRPIQPEHERIAALNALPFVDAVVVFDDDTPKALIETLTPDILVKGGDYSADQLSGGKHVKQHGGKVVIIPTMEGFSTTQLSDQPFY